MWLIHFACRCVAAIVILAGALTTVSAQPAPRVIVIEMAGAISVAAERQLTRAIEAAQKEGAEALIVRLDTPGGLVTATRDMIKQMVASPIPIVVYVAPTGARAASAGTFIVYASHVAAMSPGTNLGAATPVQMGGVPGLPGQQPKDKEQKPQQTAAERKAINDTVAMLRSLAQLRGRDAEFARDAVVDAATLTGEEALKRGVIEIVANNVEDLIAALDGRTVRVGDKDRILNTKGATHTVLEPDWRTRLLALITNPNVAFLLLMVGFYGLILEFWNPGTLIPGTIGGVSLLLALIALSALPVHYGAMALLILGLGLMVAEAFSPGIGILDLGGLVAFVVGSIFLFEGADWDIEVAISWPVILGVSGTTAALIFGVVGAAMHAYKRPPATGVEELIGMTGTVVEWQDGLGRVHVHGETWTARADKPLQPGGKVRVVAIHGLTLNVEPS